jgi:hypothetical protein
MHIDQEVFFKAAFDELGSMMKEELVKEALSAGVLGATKGVGSALKGLGRALGSHARSVGHAGMLAVKQPSQAAGLMGNVYRKAGGGIKGVGAVMKTPVGQAAGVAGATALAAPAVAGYGLGRKHGRQQAYGMR